MVSMETKMTDQYEINALENGGTVGRSIAWMAAAALGTIFTAGAIVGVIIASKEDGGTLSATAIAIIAVFAAIIGGLIYAQWRLARRIATSGGEMTSRERLNRNILIACGVMGGIIGLVLAIADGLVPSEPFAVFSDSPLPLALAILLAVFWGAIIPVIAWFWHTRAIDEQEANAYRDGGYYAAYAYLIGAPTWWFLWRGGLLPEPNGVLIFSTFAIIWSVVWYWKKYR